MSDLRFDPVTGIWVAIAQNRLDRPMEFVPIEQVRQQLICPFCGGNEEHTPPPFHSFDSSGNLLNEDQPETAWAVRAIPNKYPSFHGSANHPAKCGPFSWNDTVGHQELILPTPRHVTSLSELSPEELSASFKACQFRIEQLRLDESIKHAMLFLNCRSRAGASLGHLHFQLIGSPLISRHLQERTNRNRESVENFGQTILQRVVDWEKQKKVRVIADHENFLVVAPFASRFAFQTWVIPIDPTVGFAKLPDGIREQLSGLCRQLVKNLEEQLDNTAYNMLLHQAPFHMQEHDHWFIELFPRLTNAAGFELGTDIWVNPVAPEAAAKRLRS